MIVGGAQENTLLSCELLRRRGYEVVLITGPGLGPEGDLMGRARGGGYEVIELDGLRRAINPASDARCYFQLKKLLKALDCDIVHTHSAKAGILGRWAAWALRKELAEKGCCLLVNEVNKHRLISRGRPRIVHTIHGLSFHPYQSAIRNRFYVAIERMAAERTDAFISVAQAMTEKCLVEGIGRPEQFTKIFSGMEVGDFLSRPSVEEIAAVRCRLGIAADAVVIATVGRLFELKGHEYVIESAKRLAGQGNNVVWLFIGGGVWREKIEGQIAAAGLSEKFRLVGLVRPEEIAKLLHSSDLLVHPSLREGLARAIPQAMLCGKPVVSFDIDGAREVVIEGQTGFLVAAGDVGGLAEAQGRLLRDAGLRKRMGEAGRQLCGREFDCELMVDKIERLYHNLMA